MTSIVEEIWHRELTFKGELLDCPDCNNQGQYIAANSKGEPEQTQCEFCHTQTNSKFNLINVLTADLNNTTSLYMEYIDNPKFKDLLTLNEHCKIVGKLISLLNKHFDGPGNRRILLNEISKLADVIEDIAQNADILDKQVMAGLIPAWHPLTEDDHNMYHLFGDPNIPKLVKIIKSIDTIMTALYGPNNQTIVTLANTFGEFKNPNYWRASINTIEQFPSSDTELPPLF